jgi:hypothetical protein
MITNPAMWVKFLIVANGGYISTPAVNGAQFELRAKATAGGLTPVLRVQSDSLPRAESVGEFVLSQTTPNIEGSIAYTTTVHKSRIHVAGAGIETHVSA